MKFKTTADIPVPKQLIDQIIGQDDAVNIIKKAARQRRHVVLIGTPGTGKSMLGMALAELLPKGKVSDIVALPNEKDENTPIIVTFPSGRGSTLVEKAKIKAKSAFKNKQIVFFVIAIIALMIPWWIRKDYGDVMAAASLIGGMMLVAAIALSFGLSLRSSKQEIEPKLLVDSSKYKTAPFVDATGAHAGALLGDVKHDPLQSGGLGTPAHLRVDAGAIHKANGGVLFIDEIATLEPQSQQELLTAVQERKYPITGQSERSSGAMVRTEPVPCDFVLVAAGNTETIQKMHPALRSRVRGYGYEVYMNDTIPDNEKSREQIARFISQEVVKDKKIPHFTKEAVEEVIKESKKRAGRKGHLTLVLRDLGGLVRAAGDLAKEQNSKFVMPQHVFSAIRLSKTLEEQIADKYIERKKEYGVIRTKGQEIGRVNGLAVIGNSGIVMPIEAAVPIGGKKREIVATGQLGKIAKEAIENVSAIIMKYFGEDIKEKYDVYVQFLQTYEGVEGDSASIAVATAIISAFRGVPVRQDTAMTGSLSVRGEVLPVGGITPKIEAAIEAGLNQVIIPVANLNDVVLPKNKENKIKIIPASTIKDVLKHGLVWKGKESTLRKLK